MAFTLRDFYIQLSYFDRYFHDVELQKTYGFSADSDAG